MNNVCKRIRYVEEINNKIEINVAAQCRGDDDNAWSFAMSYVICETKKN